MKSKSSVDMPAVIAKAKLPGNGPASAIVQIQSENGDKRLVRVAKRTFLKKGALMEALADADAPLFNANERADLQDKLTNELAKVTKTIEVTFSTGWHGETFLLPHDSIGKATEWPKVIYEPLSEEVANFSKAGTLREWKDNVAAPAGHSATMTFAICLGLAAPLLEICGMEGGGVHLDGKSSRGKSLTARVARSVSGPPELQTWSTTINGLERAACSFNGSLMCVDETGAVEGTDKAQGQLIRQTAFKIAGGVGKLRAGKGWSANVKWRVFLLSTGEHSLEAFAKTAGSTRLGGEEVRFPNLPCGQGPNGIFETLPKEYTSSARLVEDLDRACASYYGFAFRQFVSKIIENRPSIRASIDKLIEEFNNYALVSEQAGWEKRFAKKFALTAAAGVLAVRWHIVPWSEEQVLHAVKKSYRRARKAVPNTRELIQRGFRRLHKRVNDPERVVDLRGLQITAKRKVVAAKHQGYIRFRKNLGLHLIVRKNRFPKWFENEQQSQLVIQELHRLGRLKCDVGRKRVRTRQIQLAPDGAKLRYYVITLKKDELAQRATRAA